MRVANSLSSKALIRIMFFIAILFVSVNATFYMTINYIFSNLSVKGKVADNLPEVVGLMNKIDVLHTGFQFYFAPVAALVFILCGLILWLSLRNMLGRKPEDAGEDAGHGDEAAADTSKGKRKEQKRLDRRMFLHLISVFQREGRLVDFFAEDINIYDDSQIGAAVRNIHENCKKTLNKYIVPTAVLDQEEGAHISIEEGFDPDLIKLTGNVTGDPPFKGILRHKGWKAGKLELPTFSSTQEEDVIAPAEVEII